MNTEQQRIERTHNTARFFTETRHISWVLLIGTIFWGVYGYLQMPQRKDPDIPIRQALALCSWRGASAEKIEQLVTRRIEEKIAENVNVDRVESNTRTGVTAVYITLVEGLADTGKEFDDIKLKLDAIKDLPDGAGPIVFVKDFGDTAALMLTVASPAVPALELELRARGVREAIERERRGANSGRVSVLFCYPGSVSPPLIERPFALFGEEAQREGIARDVRPLSVGSCSGLDL